MGVKEQASDACIYIRIMKYCFIILISITGLFMAKAQSMQDEVLIAGRKQTMHSRVLNEERTYWIQLPVGYDEPAQRDTHYPVIYLLDGELNFMATAGIRSFLNRRPFSSFPEVILVGVGNTQRTRDLTPTAAVSKKGGATLENSGGGEKFINFLEEELIPKIEATYRVDTRRVLVGHSFGALLAIHILLHHPQLFTDYLALDPSFWWDDEHLLKEADALLESKKIQGKRLYLARAGKEQKAPADLAAEDAKSLQWQFKDMLSRHEGNGLQWTYENFEHETHGTITLFGTYYGLRWLFPEKKKQRH